MTQADTASTAPAADTAAPAASAPTAKQTKAAAKVAAAAAKAAAKVAANAAKAAAAEANAKPASIQQNGVTQPSAGTASAAIWGFADTQSAAAGAPAKRGEVLAACKAVGINEATAATQFGRWCKFNGVSATPREPAAAAPAPTDAAPAAAAAE